MNKNENIPYELIAKYLAGECDAEERRVLEEWQAGDKKNEDILNELRDEWQLSDKKWSEPMVYPDRERVWDAIEQRIAPKARRISMRLWYTVGGVAASLLILLGISITWLLKQGNGAETEYAMVVSPAGQKMQLLLNDGSRVWLNSGSTLSYSKKYGRSDRMLKLTGEAFFDVKKNLKLKFVVQTGAVNVVVHGTAFNVRAYGTESDVAVSLLRGSVEVAASETEKTLAMLVPGERAVVNRASLVHTVEKCDAGVDAIWRMEELKFENATITEVAEKLSKWYGVEIEVADSNRFQKYWFKVRKETLPEILSSMNGLHPIDYTISGRKVMISSK